MWGKLINLAKNIGVKKNLKESNDNSGQIVSSILSKKLGGVAIKAGAGCLIAGVGGLVISFLIFFPLVAPWVTIDQELTQLKEGWVDFWESIGDLNTSEEFCGPDVCTHDDEKQIYDKSKVIDDRYNEIYKVDIKSEVVLGTSLYNEEIEDYYEKLTKDCIKDKDKCEEEQFTPLRRMKVRETVVEQGYSEYLSHLSSYINSNAPYQANQKLGHWAWDNFYDDEPDENSAVLRFNFDDESKDLARLSKWFTKKETVNTCIITICNASGASKDGAEQTSDGCYTYSPFSRMHEDEENYSVKDVRSYFGDLKDCDEIAKKDGGTARIQSNDEYKYDKKKYDDYLYNKYLRDKYYPNLKKENPDLTDLRVINMMSDVYGQESFYQYLMYNGDTEPFEVDKWEKEWEYCTVCNGQYDYGYEDVYTPDVMECDYTVGTQNVSNIQVRLMNCKDLGWGTPTGDELVDFETYILGVVYAEIGDVDNLEYAKTQAVAARSFALTRAKEMGNAAGISLEQDGGQWILSIRNCTEDQVYCDPNNGCHKYSGENSTTLSGPSGGSYYKEPLPEDAVIREAVKQTAGEVLLDANGDIIVTGYVSSVQNSWESMANGGSDYNEILMSTYGDANGISDDNCVPATGDWENWKQYDEQWGNQPINPFEECSDDTLASAGCALTSVAIQLARSGATLNPEFVAKYGSLTPATFAAALAENGGFTCDNIYWSATSYVSSNFVYAGGERLDFGVTGSEAAAMVSEYISQGYYVVIGVKNRGHYVAVDKVVGDDIYVFDPSNSNGILSDLYGSLDGGAIYQIEAYKKTG